MKTLVIYNIASHYRGPIFRLMDKELGCDFVVGDKADDIKKMDYSTLSHKVKEVKNVQTIFGGWQVGVPSVVRADYDTFIVLGETRSLSTWAFLLRRKLFYPKKRVFLWSHGMLGDEGFLKRMGIKLFYSLSNGAFIYNQRSVKIMSERGIPSSKLHTIYNSLDYDTQLLIRKSLKPSNLYQEHFANNNNNIVFIGRLTKVKRFDLLLDAVGILRTQGKMVNVTFIGDGIERNNMERRVDDLGIRNQVWFYGASYDEIKNAEMIYNADVCVSPGNIGLTAMHVLMFGCPAITHNDFNTQMPEFEAIQEGVTGAFFTANDSLSLAECIKQWFENHKEDREKVRETCYKEIDSKWNPHVQIEIMKKTLNEE